MIKNHFQQGIGGYKTDAEEALALKYLLSRFDKISLPQMDIGIYEEHTLLITKLDKVTKHYACAECQARHHQSMPFEVTGRGLYEWSEQGGVSRRENPAARNCL